MDSNRRNCHIKDREEERMKCEICTRWPKRENLNLSGKSLLSAERKKSARESRITKEKKKGAETLCFTTTMGKTPLGNEEINLLGSVGRRGGDKTRQKWLPKGVGKKERKSRLTLPLNQLHQHASGEIRKNNTGMRKEKDRKGMKRKKGS